jgi:type VI protein secretion system component VasK
MYISLRTCYDKRMRHDPNVNDLLMKAIYGEDGRTQRNIDEVRRRYRRRLWLSHVFTIIFTTLFVLFWLTSIAAIVWVIAHFVVKYW